MPNETGRQSPRIQQAITDAQMKQLIVDMSEQMTTIVEDNRLFKEQLLEQNTRITELERVSLKRDNTLLNEHIVRLDQYSRKDVIIMTGLKYDENETRSELEKNCY